LASVRKDIKLLGGGFMAAVKRKVYFYNRHGDKLAGIITYPMNPDNLSISPAVLLCQGLSGIKNLVLPTIADSFAKEGWISLTFDYSGFGESEGQQGWIDPFKRIEDAHYAAEFLARDPHVNKNKMGIYGISYGGPVAISLLSRIPYIKAAVAVSAPGNGRLLMRQLRDEDSWNEFIGKVDEARETGVSTGKWIKTDIFKLFPFSQKFMDKYSRLGQHPQSSAVNNSDKKNQGGFFLNSADLIMAFHPEEEVRKKGKIPLLLISGDLDDVATPVQVRSIFENAPEPKELVFLKGMDHVDLDAGPGLKEQIRMSISCFKKYI
jgi:pimeloyl-ACP methyl ester carboxylesterase